MSDAWTAVVTVAGTATLGEGWLLKTVAESAAGTAGDTLAGSAAGTAPITSLSDFQISVSDLLPHIILLFKFLSRSLPFGGKERLLLSFYGGCIPPLRNDLHACAIQLLKCGDDEAAQQPLLHQVTPNEILLPVDRNAARVLILRAELTN